MNAIKFQVNGHNLHDELWNEYSIDSKKKKKLNVFYLSVTLFVIKNYYKLLVLSVVRFEAYLDNVSR